MRYAILAAAALLASCNHVPVQPVERVPAVTLKPVADNNAKIKGQNKTIRQQNSDLQAKVDAAIVAAHQAREEANAKEIDRQKLNARLDEVDKQQAAAKEQAKQQADTIGAQAETIAAQDATIEGKQGEVDNVKKLADRQSDKLDKANQRVADLEKLEEQVNSYWGFGGILYGIKRLGWHIIILLAILAALGFVLNLFVPMARPILHGMAMFFVGLGKTIWGLISRLWRRKEPPT